MENLNILMVGGDAGFREMLVGGFEREAPDMSLHTAGSGMECLEYIKNNKTDCILSSDLMPDMVGIGLLRAIRDTGSDIPFILVAGRGSEELARAAFLGGADDYFSRGSCLAGVADLAASVEQAVRKREASRERRLEDDVRRREEEKYRALIESKEMQDAVHESEEKFRTLFESADDSIFVMDEDKFVDCNPRTLEIFGCNDRSDLIGHTPWEYSPEVQPDGIRSETKARDILQAAYEDGPQRFFWEHIKKDGTRIDTEVSLNRITLKEKLFLLAIVRDITERRRAEEKLVESEQKFRTMFDEATDGILLADMDSKMFKDGNKTICNMLGYSKEEVKTLGVLDIHPKEDLPSVIEQFDRQARGEFTLARGLPVKRKDGSVIFADINSSPIILDGKTYMMGIFRDTTARKMAEDALRNEVAVSGALLEAASITSRNIIWEEVTENIAVLVHELTGGKSVLIFRLVDDGLLLPQSAAGMSGECQKNFFAMRARVGDISLFRDAIKTKATMLLTRDELDNFGLSGYSSQIGLLDLLLSPVTTRGETVGFICVNFDGLPTDSRVVTIIEGISRQLGVAYDNSKLYMETQNKSIELARSLETLKVLSDIDKRILSSLGRDEMMEGAMYQIRRVAPADVAGVLLLDEDAGVLKFCYGWSLNVKVGDVIRFDRCAGYPTLKSGKTLVRKNLTEETMLTEIDKALLEGGIKSDIYVPIISKGKGVGLLHTGSYRVAGFALEDIRTVENLANQIGIALENSRLLSDIEEMFISVVTAFASAIDAKSPWTKGHSERVTRYAIMLAENMGLGRADVENLRLAGLLHDIGKIGTYDVILEKRTRLTDDEFELVKKHPVEGADILKPIKQFKDIIPIIRHHHEHWDGSGYPDGLKGEEIPLLARILCVADSFDSITEDRPYRPSPGIEFAAEEFRSCAGTQFDPVIVEALIGLLGDMRSAA